MNGSTSGKGGGRQHAKSRTGIVGELRRRVDFLDAAIKRAERDGRDGVAAMRTELCAMREAAAIVETATLPERPPVMNPTPRLRDEWRQLAGWAPARQVAVLCAALERLARPSADHDAAVIAALNEAHHDERRRAATG